MPEAFWTSSSLAGLGIWRVYSHHDLLFACPTPTAENLKPCILSMTYNVLHFTVICIIKAGVQLLALFKNGGPAKGSQMGSKLPYAYLDQPEKSEFFFLPFGKTDYFMPCIDEMIQSMIL